MTYLALPKGHFYVLRQSKGKQKQTGWFQKQTGWFLFHRKLVLNCSGYRDFGAKSLLTLSHEKNILKGSQNTWPTVAAFHSCDGPGQMRPTVGHLL